MWDRAFVARRGGHTVYSDDPRTILVVFKALSAAFTTLHSVEKIDSSFLAIHSTTVTTARQESHT